MVTIKDVAALAQVSPSTVSIVLKGKAEARKISVKTQQKVIAAARELGYMPNIQAQVLRGGDSLRTVVSLFWTTDIRLHILTRFINGLQSMLVKTGYPCELQIHPYENDHLDKALTERTMHACNGMIICNASETDMVFLENLQCPVPIVLYNRYSNRYSTINMDDKIIGRLPAQVFARHGRKRPAIIQSPATFNGMNIRTNLFSYQTSQEGMEPPVILTTEDCMRGGYESARKLCALDPLPDCVFFTSDQLALGALKAFSKYGIKIPEQMELISIGSGESEFQEYAIPSLSVIKLPMEEMAAACLERLFRHLTEFDRKIDVQVLPVSYVARQSCPE